MWYRRRRRRTTVTKHYLAHKETAREYIVEKVRYWNTYYGFPINRIAIRNQKTCWGSCSEHNNLNFNYKLLFLPEHLADYVIVHEICHLGELNHSPAFWELVGRTQPEYKMHRKELRNITKV
jgi:predicted metal-dependent hydrolase